MTTTVMIAVQGNKEVSIETPTGRMVLPPGKWVHGLQIHGCTAAPKRDQDPGR